MNDEQLDDVLQDLKEELSFTPSPEFAAKVRQRIDQALARSFWNVWTWTAVAATCGIAVVAGAMLLRPSDGVVITPNAPTTDPQSAPSITQHMPTTPIAPTVATTPAIATNARTTSTTTKPVVVAATAPRERQLEVLVSPDELNAIRQIMSAVRAGAIKNAPTAQSLIDPDTGELVKPKLIEIPLISVEPLPGPSESRGGGSERK